MKIKQRGFTLVEVLIVVIIIAILAALILPRMTAQTGRAEIAEAQQMLGVLRRAQETYMDTTGTTDYVAVQSFVGVAPTPAELSAWSMIGMTAPASNKFNYGCNILGLGNVCAAQNAADTNSVIAMADNGQFNCDQLGTGNYTAVSVTDPSKGCTTK